ncbi:hypothetical protein AAG570_005331 [Ranatra chinensis]|uniref:Sorting nexin 13 n=1 Tax=Ranatra chinensis TaxID=642074 RepID=A0ABD0Y102_9HEMI
MKEIDWIPYLTTRLVDDAASHLRLYRQARSKLGGGGGGEASLEALFFDLEISMEQNLVCRDHICTQPALQRCYLQRLCDVVMFLLAPEIEFHCLPLRYLAREILVNVVLTPLINQLSDPDYINRILIWLCRDIPITSEVFLTVLRVTDSVDELVATKELLNKEIQTLRSRDAGGDSDLWVKQQLSSLLYVGKVVDNQLARLQEGEFPSASMDYYRMFNTGTKLFQLPLDVIMKNNIALSYFMDYMTSIGAQNYLFFYLNIEGWKVSAEQQLADLALQFDRGAPGDSILLAEQFSSAKQTLDRIKEAACTIFEQYLADKAGAKVKLDDTVVRRLLNRIRTERPNENWFDEVQACVFEKLQTEERFLNGFRSSGCYVKLLADLDLLKENSRSDDDDSRSLDEISVNSDTASLPEFTLYKDSGYFVSEVFRRLGRLENSPKKFNLTRVLIPGLVHEKGKMFGIYALSVCKRYENGHKESWHIYRRYSDFYDLHQKIREKFVELGKLNFPGKKTFHNMERKTLERRMVTLNSYLRAVLQGCISKPGLLAIVFDFLQPGDYDKHPVGHFTKTLDSLFRVSMQAMRTVPDSLMSSVDGVVDGLTRVLQADNIPMRIMLLLMTEVFDLKSGNQWLRRRVVTLLRQIVRTMFGDIVNRRILDYVYLMTSPDRVAGYLKTFKDAYWPNGVRAEPTLPRDHPTKMRTRVAAKAALLSSLSDELKHILGNETSRCGMLSVFSLLQCRTLNTRFVFVLLEGTLSTLLGEANMQAILRKLHSKSERVQRHANASTAVSGSTAQT